MTKKDLLRQLDGFKKVMAAQHNESLFLRGKVYKLESHLTEVYQQVAQLQERIRITSKECSILEAYSTGIIRKVMEDERSS